MYDLFMSAGRDWGIIVEGASGPQVMVPEVVSSHAGPFRAGSGVRVAPDLTLDRCPPVEIVCVPELLVPPGRSIEG